MFFSVEIISNKTQVRNGLHYIWQNWFLFPTLWPVIKHPRNNNKYIADPSTFVGNQARKSVTGINNEYVFSVLLHNIAPATTQCIYTTRTMDFSTSIVKNRSTANRKKNWVMNLVNKRTGYRINFHMRKYLDFLLAGIIF